MDAGLLILRLVVGGAIAAHGAQKLFGWFGGYGLSGTAGWLESLGFRPGRFHATLTALAEFGGGLLLVFGFLTPLGAAALIGVMLVAIASVHWKSGFFNGAGGYEFNLVLIAAAAALAFTGAGGVSIDRALGLGFGGISWGLYAVGAGALVAGVVMASRGPVPAAVEDDTAASAGDERVIDLTAEEERASANAGR